MPSTRFPWLLLVLATVFVASGFTQTATGAPPFSSLGGGPFDTVNLGNLDVNFSVPILNKAGRGIPFTYYLAYDTSIYQIAMVNGQASWTPTVNAGDIATYWGWQNLGPVYAPYVQFSYTYSTGTCGQNQTYQEYQYFNYVYHDAKGTLHPFSATASTWQCTNGQSAQNPTTPTAFTATDGSGYVLTIPGGPYNLVTAGTITTTSGVVTNTPFPQPPVTSTPFTPQDSNGNRITFQNGTYTDTLGTTVLTAQGTEPSPTTFTYTSPVGSESYTINYSPYNIQTKFSCSAVPGEYSATNAYLVSSIVLPDGSQYAFNYEYTPGSTTTYTGRLKQITLPTGGTIAYSYTGSNDGINCADGSTNGLTRTLTPGGEWQYVRSGSGTNWTTTVTDPSNNQTAISFQEYNNNFYETERLSYQGSTSGTLLRTDYTCYNGQSLSTPSNCPTTATTAQVTQVTAFHYLPNSSGLQSETNSTYDQFGLIHEVDDYDYGTGAVGGLIRKTLTTYTSGMSNGIVDRPYSVIIEDGSSNIKAATYYGYDVGTLATPTGTTPQWVSVSGSHGNLTSVSVQANSSVNLYRTYTYFNTGMLNTSTDVSTSSTINGATTTYNYSSTGNADCGNSFVTSITEPVHGMSRSFTWDCNGGVLLSVKDENQNTSSTAYSGSNYSNYFWRPYSTTDEAGNTTSYFYYLTTATPPVEFQTESKSATFNGGASIVDNVTTTDGFGRTTFSQAKQSPTSSYYSTTAHCYDGFGRTSETTYPYTTTLAMSSTICPTSADGNLFYYDALGRQSEIKNTDGGYTTYTYNENDTLQTRTSPSISTQSEFDGLGRLTSVCEVTSGTSAWPSGSCKQNTSATGYLTTYTYDPLGNRTGVTQNAQSSSNQQTRAFLYDMLSRLTSETNPENNNTAITYAYDSLSTDPSCGTITSAGNLLKRTDPAGTGCYSGYDALHRVGTITYPSTSTPTKGFVYDAATVNGTNMANAATHLAEAYTCTGTCSSKITDLGFGYAPTGQTSGVWELTPHSGTNVYYQVSNTFWPNGAVEYLQNLTGLPTFTYGTNGVGQTLTVSASTGQNPITSTSYDPGNKVTGLTYGSADSDAFTIDPNTGRMTKYVFKMGTGPSTVTGNLTWNLNGTLETLAITDQINSNNTQTCNNTYDSLGRVASTNCLNGSTNVWNQDFAYDPFGNITKTIPTGGTGTAFQPTYNTNNHMTSTPFTYNGNAGDLTADNSHSYGWDAADRLSTIDSGAGNGVCVTYDALDRVVEQGAGSSCSSYTEVVYSPAGGRLALMNGSSLVKAFVPLPGGAQAVYSSSGLLFYRHPDWLGSSRLATTPSRTCYSDVAYAPFGENYAAPSSGCVAQDLMFTGQNQDTETSTAGGVGGLYDFMFRRHSPVQGRWLSPDPGGLSAVNPSDPQSWNRYAYVGNRPLNTTDTFGLDPDCWDPNDPFCPDGGGEPWGYCPPSQENCDAPDCDPVIDCEPGGPGNPSGGGPGGGGGGEMPSRVGGVWPSNETLGLPSISNAPLDGSGLFGLLPGLNCGGGGTAVGFTQGTSTPTTAPCFGPLATIMLALEAVPGGQSDNSGNSAKADSNYGAGTCVAVPLIQLRAFPFSQVGGCFYLCEIIAEDPLVSGNNILFGPAVFKASTINRACGPGRFCPKLLTVEVPNVHEGFNDKQILSCLDF